MIHTLVPDAISTESYRKALISNIFSCQIMTISDTLSVSFSNFMSTVASYFGLNAGSAEKEAKITAIDIRNIFSLVSNLQGVIHEIKAKYFFFMLVLNSLE